jgi:hydrocephalus-inducing protein
LFRLKGSAGPALAEETQVYEVKCKQPFTAELQVKNWLDSYQRFTVLLQTEKQDESVSITGSANMDVPASLERTYKVSFYAYKEGSTKASVTFINDVTQESLMFPLEFQASSDSSKATDKLPPFETVVRVMQEKALAILNPLDQPAVFEEFVCDDPSVFIPGMPLTAAASSEAKLSVQYRPLVPCQRKKATLTLKSSLLGEFTFDLALTANVSGAPRVLRFSTNLGGDLVQTHRFLSFSSSPVDYECKVTGTDFTVETVKVSAPACPPGGEGVECAVEVRFEPSKMGKCSDVLTISGGDAGTYLLTLQGNCDAPKPQGPVIVKASGGAAAVRFKVKIQSHVLMPYLYLC